MYHVNKLRPTFMEYICVGPGHFYETQLKGGSMDTSKKCKKHFHKLITQPSYTASHP